MISEPETQTFTHFGLSKTILHDLAAMGYQTPTPVQARCIPPALEGRDVIGLAQTGTGKTAAFGLPIIQRVANEMEMRALVIAPTRELAQQITAALRDLGRSSGLRVAIVVGGIPIKEDYKALRSWPNVLVATPGRLLDHIHSRTVSLSDVQIIAVDEADRMYDMGFMPQIEGIMEVLPPKRQTLMFTATMPAQVERLVRRHMNDPVRIQVGLTAPPRKAEQRLHFVQEPDKMRLLLDLLGDSQGRVLVFVRTKRKVDRVAREVARRHRVARIHGDREQKEREAAMNGFRTGVTRILIATDIAARGIDVADIEHVINFDFPRCPEDYVHRIGRTARIGAAGLATSFVTHIDRACLAQVERLISARLPVTHFGAPRSGAGGIEPRVVREAQPAHPARAAGPTRHPEQVEPPRRAEHPRRMEQPRREEQPRRAELPRRDEHPRRIEQPRHAEHPRRMEQSRRDELPRRVEQQRPMDPPRHDEMPRHPDHRRHVEHPRRAEQPRQVEHTRRDDLPRHVEHRRPAEPQHRGEHPRQAEPQRHDEHPRHAERPPHYRRRRRAD